jgi:putative transposase
MWAHLQREGIPVARSTVERLMRAHGWQGVRRQTKVRTTVVDPAAARAPDLVDRQFAVPAPNRLLVADFTYVRLACGVFVYVAFVIDAYAGAIIGWEVSGSKQTRFVESAIRQAIALRSRQGQGRTTRVCTQTAISTAGSAASSSAIWIPLAEAPTTSTPPSGSWPGLR